MKQKGYIFAVFIILILMGAVGFFGYEYFKNTLATITPSPAPIVSPQASPTEVLEGTVSGRLCYPSSFLPPGEIVAKDISSEKTYTENYAGSMAGGKTTYTIGLPAGTYHLRYQAHASTKDTSIFTSGYFDECAKTMHTNECTPDSGHIIIPVTIAAGEEVANVDLCDFYYNPTQMETLNSNF